MKNNSNHFLEVKTILNDDELFGIHIDNIGEPDEKYYFSPKTRSDYTREELVSIGEALDLALRLSKAKK